MRQHVASFANFICRFGSNKVLLDYAKEIVLPSFTDDTLIRSYGRTHFFFYDTKLSVEDRDSDEPTILISGQFIKNTQLTREQIFDAEKGIVQDDASIASAPSAFFVLILNNHRLIYFPETAYAPTLDTFRATVERFLNIKHKKFIDTVYEEHVSDENKVTKKSLYEIHPRPTLDVIAITGDEEIEDFVRRYSVLKKIEFRVVRPNDEIDGGEIFNEIRDFVNPINPTSTKLVTASSDGLDIEKAIPRIKLATDTANQEIKLTGIDEDGNDLKGDNHEFKIGAPIEPLPATRQGLLRKLLGTFNSLKSDGTIKVGERDPSVREKILELVRVIL